MPKVPSPLEFARDCKPRRGSICSCCSDAEIKKAIAIVVRERIEGRSEATATGLHEYLRENYGLKVSTNGLRRHLHEHTKWYEAGGAS